jgi:L-serine/L-threonine ammonia-lyase
MAHLCEALLESKGKGVKLISSSGGNAGLAVTTVASQLGMEVDVVVPETTKPLVVEKLTLLGAKVIVFGKNWNAADELARELVEKDANAEYVSPYDNSLLWTGHSSLMDELVEEMPDKFGAIVASVGGGGLICGILEGIERHSLYSTRVITSETEGAASFQKAWLQGRPIRLESIDSVATSLGALEVTPVSLERAKALTARGGSFVPLTCTDAEAIDASLKFASHHRMLVEPACGAALAVVYSERLRNSALDGVEGAVVVEVCGGSGVNLDLMQMWKEEFL